MATITIRHLELRRVIVETAAMADIHVNLVLDGRLFTDWFTWLSGDDGGWIGWEDHVDWEGKLMGRHGEPEIDGLTEIAICPCGCSGCNPLLVLITVDDQTVTWSRLSRRGVEELIEVPDVEFRFDRTDYEQAIADFHDWDGALDE